jgi:hypothetical protein
MQTDVEYCPRIVDPDCSLLVGNQQRRYSLCGTVHPTLVQVTLVVLPLKSLSWNENAWFENSEISYGDAPVVP